MWLIICIFVNEIPCVRKICVRIRKRVYFPMLGSLKHPCLHLRCNLVIHFSSSTLIVV
jgi:hypothetical protein